MRTFVLALLIALTLPVSAFAASYQQIDGELRKPESPSPHVKRECLVSGCDLVRLADLG